MDRDLVDTGLMPSALEGCIEEGRDDLLSLLLRDEASGQREYVSIVVLTGELSQLDIPAEGSTYPRVLVHDHGDPIARATDGDPSGELSLLDRPAYRMGEVGVITSLAGVTAEVLDRQPSGDELSFHKLLDLVASVVGANAYLIHII